MLPIKLQGAACPICCGQKQPPEKRFFPLVALVQLHLVVPLLGEEHLPGLAALKGPHNAPLLHLIHQAGGAGIAYLQAALEKGSRGQSRLHHHLDGIGQQLVLSVVASGCGPTGFLFCPGC